MLAGAAGGIGAIFRAPLGGALFAGEVLYSTTAIEAAALLPCLASSIVAYSTFALFITPRPIFIVPDLAFHGLRELAALRRAGARLRGGRLALRPGLLRPARLRLPADADPPARQAGDRRPAARAAGAGVPRS